MSLRVNTRWGFLRPPPLMRDGRRPASIWRLMVLRSMGKSAASCGTSITTNVAKWASKADGSASIGFLRAAPGLMRESTPQRYLNGKVDGRTFSRRHGPWFAIGTAGPCRPKNEVWLVACSVVKVCCGGHRRAIPMHSHRDASHVLIDLCSAEPGPSLSDPALPMADVQVASTCSAAHRAGSHPHA